VSGAPRIDPRALVHPEAALAEDVEVGPFTVIEAGVAVGAGSRIGAQSYLCRGTVLGRENVVHMGVALGNEPQDLSYRGAPTGLVVGDRNVFREGCTVHRGTAEGSTTKIGSDCFFMSNTHVAHNCDVADGVVMASGALLGGYVHVGERAFLSGNAVVHQHTRVGRLAILQGVAAISSDLPPFLIGAGINTVRGVNLVGLRRAGFDRTRIAAVRRAYRTLFFGRPNLGRARESFASTLAAEGGPTADVAELLAFLAEGRRFCSAAPIARASRTGDGTPDEGE